MLRFKTFIQSMRVPFLVFTPVCVFLGVSTSIARGITIDYLLVLLILAGALCAHVSVNTFNEYFDFKSGLDLTTQRTSFSGGSGALLTNPEAAPAVLVIAIVSLIATAAIGSIFLWQHGTGILPIGIIGLLLIVTYTQWINKSPLLCLVAPGTGFGFLIVPGTDFVLSGSYDFQVLAVAVIPFLLANNLLLLNQYPDIDADRGVGRNHFPIAYGVKASNLIYGIFILLMVIIIITSVITGYLPGSSLVTLVTIPLALFTLAGAIKHGKKIGEHPVYLAANVVMTIVTPLLLGLSLIHHKL